MKVSVKVSASVIPPRMESAVMILSVGQALNVALMVPAAGARIFARADLSANMPPIVLSV